MAKLVSVYLVSGAGNVLVNGLLLWINQYKTNEYTHVMTVSK